MQQKYKFAVIATDVVIFTILNNQLNVLAIAMKKAPYKGQWAVPGGLVGGDESVDASAARNLFQKTGVKDVYLEQFLTFGKVNRDPFGRVVSVAYMALIPSDGVHLSTTGDYAGVQWFPVDRLPKMAYDHRDMVRTAVARLREKVRNSNIVYSLLPREFSLSDLQKTYEAIVGERMDKRNFRKKILAVELVKATGRMELGKANRPAELYVFTNRTPKAVSLL